MSVTRTISMENTTVYEIVGDGVKIVVQRAGEPTEKLEFPRTVIPLLAKLLLEVHGETEDSPGWYTDTQADG